LHAPHDDAAVRQVDDLRGRTEALVKPLLDKKQSVGVVVGVIDAGRTRVFGFGREALGGDKTPDGQTIFEIGSVTKVFTSLALAQLAQEGLVRIDDPVGRHLPSEVKVASVSKRDITLEDLATHTSGLPRVPVKVLIVGARSGDPYANYTEKDLYDFLKGWKPTQVAGTKWEYSNLGAGLLGHALARRAGVDYSQLISSRITQPLGLKDTRMKLDGAQEKRMAKPYGVGNKPANLWSFDVLAGCGALHSTADDLLVFLAAEIGLKETKLRSAMEITQKPNRDTGTKGMRMGLGWIVNTLPSADGPRNLYWHNGGTGGFSSFVGFVKEWKLGVVVLANAGPGVGSFGAVDTVGMGVLTLLKEQGIR
jgi:CubicO group peptidase (beta-lactamase class C family)